MNILGQEKNIEYIRLAAKEDLPALLIGPTGVAKTSSISQVADELGKELIRFSLTGETTTNDYVGRYELTTVKGDDGNVASDTIWCDGPLLQAMQEGKWLVSDEINAALPEILFCLHSLLDHDKQITLVQRNGQVIRPHPDFRFFATMNPVEDYTGTKEMNKALLSRFPMILLFDYPDMETEADIIKQHTSVDDNVAATLAEAAAQLRLDEDIFYTCSTRDLIYCAQLVKHGMEFPAAINISIINRADEQERQRITDIMSNKVNEVVEYVKKREHISLLDKAKNAEVQIEKAKTEYKAKIKKNAADYKTKERELKKTVTAELEAIWTKEKFDESYAAYDSKDPVIDLTQISKETSIDGVAYKSFSFVLTDADGKRKPRKAHINLRSAPDEQDPSVLKLMLKLKAPSSHPDDESCEHCGTK